MLRFMRSPVAAGVEEDVLLRETRVFAQAFRVKVLREMLLERPSYPHVYGEALHMPETEKCDAVRDLFPYAGEPEKLTLGGEIVSMYERVEVEPAAVYSPCRRDDIRRTVAAAQ